MPYGIFPRHKYRDPPRSRSGLKGVVYFPRCTRKPWKAYGRRKGQYVCIGYYPTKEEAARAYNRWALQLFGPTAYLNRV
jgi:hypothetical protein